MEDDFGSYGSDGDDGQPCRPDARRTGGERRTLEYKEKMDHHQACEAAKAHACKSLGVTAADIQRWENQSLDYRSAKLSKPLGLYAANSIFVGDYLTTKGQPPEADYRMIEELGFTVTTGQLNR